MALNLNAGYGMYPTASQMIWVQGPEAAKSYPVAPGNRVPLFDSENPTVYVKAVDQMGKPLPMEIYDLVLRKPVEQKEEPKETIDLSNYITRDEISNIISESVSKEVDKAISSISLKPSTSKKKKEGDE
jgi:hypothetical protein